MRVGLFLSLEHELKDDRRQRFVDLTEFVRAADEAGFDFLHAGQHVLVPQFQYFQSLPVLARIAAEVSDIEIGTDILLLALHHPVHVAELVATLDVICNGRFSLGVGLGYRDVEFDSLGVAKGTRLRRFVESIEVIKKLWTEDVVTHHGEFYQLDEVSLAVRPLQNPRPPIIVAASGDKMVKRAARIADALSLTGHDTLDTLVRQVEIYRETLSSYGKTFPPKHFRVSKELFVGPTRALAEQHAFPFIEAKYKAYAAWGQDSVLPSGETFDQEIRALAKNRFIIGSPQECVDEVLRHHELLAFRDFSFRLHYPGMSHRQSMMALELFAEQVLPALQSQE